MNTSHINPRISRRAFICSAGSFALFGAIAASGCAEIGPHIDPQPGDTPQDETNTAQTDSADATVEKDLAARTPLDIATLTGTLDERTAQVLEALTLEQKVGQLFIIRPEGLINNNSALTDDSYGDIQSISETFGHNYVETPVGGVCIFAGNIVEPNQLYVFNEGIQYCSRHATGLPAFIAIDEEGGLVSRIGGKAGFEIDNVGPMLDVGYEGPGSAYDVGLWIGTYLREYGCNLDFAPVADVVYDPYTSSIGNRSFGADPAYVAECVTSEIAGFKDALMLCSPKHFPGIGNAVGDSHDSSIYTEKPLENMLQEELVPFAAAIEAQVPFIMVGHITCTYTNSNLPASLDPAILKDLLRKQMGFDGIITTDSLEMGAVGNLYGWDNIGVAALDAGVDVILMPANFKVAYQGILNAVKEDRLTEARIDESVTRIIRCKLAYLDSLQQG